MKGRLRYLLLVLFLGAPLLLGLGFPQFTREVIVLPAATAVWIFLRLFVLSVHQQVFWWGAIALAVLAAFGAFHPKAAAFVRVPPAHADPARDRAGDWRDALRVHLLAETDEDSFRRDLMWLFTTMYCSRHQGKAKHQVRDDILEHRIPIPDSIYMSLFFSPRPVPRKSLMRHPVQRLRQMSGSLRRKIRRWIRRHTGRETANRARAIDEVLSFMETTLEMRQDNDATEIPRLS